ncbi:uncharacterized protein PHACADRAFT_206866 [Phanerochaete carnosa HHB-10118-sp]|uniref:Alpha/beta hydrolase fold-3 domain-containing protein n=1 Tax=Phanerochaete carnosa (strain HHB-10118-sp) TaxID=650164 RepID=K5WFE8_PHACS|nr:uncharacterized protein PHACADRAFT_206866 [Phanerochaete carnosa HHB-10118-sp]EKM58025.1 hypothetical protein PHACADRAFT_206866 [Phanerochaete carnosa HHB-10118-sp]
MGRTKETVPPHLEEMPYAKEPLKTAYVVQRLLTTLLLVPWWAMYYTVQPRRKPRESWGIKQVISVKFTRRVYRVTELAGVTWGTRNPEKACKDRELKETRFEWADLLPEQFRSGIIVDDEVPFKRVGAFVWPREMPKELNQEPKREPKQDTHIDLEAGGKQHIVAIFLHGGGYCHMSAHEKSSTSKIPRRLVKDKAFDEIYAVEYRLLQHAPFPAAVQDAAAVYAHVLRKYQCLPDLDELSRHHRPFISRRGRLHPNDAYLEPWGNSRAELLGTPNLVNTYLKKSCKVVLIGDSAGGNLVLALARWIRDEGKLPPPDGLLLLSPSCDPSHAFPDTPSSYIPRPHESTDYLVDTPEPRALLQRTFLGHHPLEMMHSPYVSPASHRVLRTFYGEVFATSVQDLTIDALTGDFMDKLRTIASVPPSPDPGTVLGPGMPTPVTPGMELSPSLSHPVIASPRGLSLFSEFPRTCVVLGDAERLEREVMKLIGAMESDGVRVHTIRVRDAPHDVLMMGWWDEKVRDETWQSVGRWVAELATSR